MTLKTAPVAGARLKRWPWKTWPGRVSATTLAGLAGFHSGELILLEIGVDPQAVRRHDRQQISALRDIGSDLRRAIADIAVNRRADFGIAEIEPGGLEIGPRLRNCGCSLGNIGIQDVSCCFAAARAACADATDALACASRAEVRSASCREP